MKNYISPQQELFAELLTSLRDEFADDGIKVYDGELPPEGTPYPFIYLSDAEQSDGTNTKDHLFGRADQTIDVWMDDTGKRGTLTRILTGIGIMSLKLEKTEHYTWKRVDCIQRIIPDNTTSTPLLHGVLEVTYEVCRR
ncbi:MAG: hypothetical protein Q4B15_03275 [Lachnospiraceae bacterium]|nr:hypothetical protein [Lachnospiraceae bacterium]